MFAKSIVLLEENLLEPSRSTLTSYLVKTRSSYDPNLYFKVIPGIPLILILYVNDVFSTGGEPLKIECKREMAFEFEMKYCEIYFRRYEFAWIR